MGKILEKEILEKVFDRLNFDRLNLFAGLSVIATTILTVIFFEKYAKKKLPPADGFDKQEPPKEIHDGWFGGLFCAEFLGQVMATESLDAIEAVLVTVLNVAMNIVVFFICYKILGVAGVDKENLYARCKKAFMGLVLLSWALIMLADYALDMQADSSRNVPAVNQEVQAEFVTTLNGENIFIDLNTLERTNSTHSDAAPEFKCVLIDTAEIRTNCEFHARGIVVMFIDGQRVGDSDTEPEIGELYNAIVQKFL